MRVLLLFTVVAVAFASEECGENAHFESCGTACPLTCENNNNPPKVCITRCEIGCQCDEGYVKHSNGQCVKPEQCSSSAAEQCGENSHFESCGTACALTCENYQNPPRFCNMMCDIGCHCDEGYVKTIDGRCVRPEQCPSSAPEQCVENAHSEKCGTACPLTCDNYQNPPPKVCIQICDNGCHCDKGYVKSSDGRCVKPEECPSRSMQAEKKTCFDKPESGVCMAYFPSWYFDKETQKCNKFIYGGCGGNGNRYNTEEECLENCQGRSAPSACMQKKAVGPCKGSFERYFFNQETAECERFYYSGCQGTSNNFLSKEDCEAVCKA